MKTRLTIIVVLFVLSYAALATEDARAVLINPAGSQLGLTDFRTTSVAKPLDADGDNAYGTDGYLFFNMDEGGNGVSFFTNAVQLDPAYVSGFAAGTGGPGSPARQSSGNSTMLLIDDPTLGQSPSVANRRSAVGIITVSGQQGVEYELLRMTLGSGLPSGGFRMGVFADNLAANNVAAAIRLSGPGGNSGPVILTGNNNQDGDWYFFDVLGASGGDVLSLHITRNSSSATSQGIGGVVFDSLPIPIPEPSTFTLLAVAGFVHLRRRPRKGSR